jgi:hypothetical protein
MKNRAKRVKRLMKVWAVELRLQELKDELALLRLSCDFVVVRNGKAFNPKTKKLKEDIAILEEGKAIFMEDVRTGDRFDQREQN